MGDLVRLLEEAGRVARLPDNEHPAGLVTHRHPEGVVSLDCPLACLDLPVRAAKRLRRGSDCRTVGDLLRLLRSGELLDIRGIGVGAEAEIKRTFLRAGIDPDDWRVPERA
ncbi:hypothetical protein [Actinomadura keratinilytica]|uniref:hypothetical protein n=1 Tax=Actinomadura keratinilytica TaxID=547461 RepID=UPI0031E65A46